MKNKAGYLIAFCLTLVLMLNLASADIGPKPTAGITVFYENAKISGEFEARMFVCDNSNWTSMGENNESELLGLNIFDAGRNCSWHNDPIAWTNPCIDSKCHFGYFLPEKFRLAVYLPEMNKTFITDEIARPNFDSTYRADLYADGSTKIKETTSITDNSQFQAFAYALIVTLIVELLVWWISAKIKKIERKILWWVLLANVISLCLIWFVAPITQIFDSLHGIIIAELCVVVFEALFVYFINRNRISLLASFVISLIANIASVVIGIFLVLIYAAFGFGFLMKLSDVAGGSS